MRHNLPSVKTLARLSPEHARAIRKVLEITSREKIEELFATDEYPVTKDWYRMCFHPMPLQLAKLSIVSELLPMASGVEGIGPGHNAKSPGIDYINMGDPYRTTLMYVSGKGYRVGCWGDIIERGNYD